MAKIFLVLKNDGGVLGYLEEKHARYHARHVECRGLAVVDADKVMVPVQHLASVPPPPPPPSEPPEHKFVELAGKTPAPVVAAPKPAPAPVAPPPPPPPAPVIEEDPTATDDSVDASELAAFREWKRKFQPTPPPAGAVAVDPAALRNALS